MSFHDSDFVSFRCIPRSGIAGSFGSSIKKIFKNLHIFSQSGCTNLYSHQQCTRVPFPSLSPQNLSLAFMIIATLTGVSDISLWF